MFVFFVDLQKYSLFFIKPEFCRTPFFIEPDELIVLQDIDVFRFLGIEITHKIEDIYGYKQKVNIEKFQFSQEAVNLNSNKWNLVSKLRNKRDDDYYDCDDDNDWKGDFFDAMTDGQLGDWEDFEGDTDDIMNWAGR